MKTTITIGVIATALVLLNGCETKSPEDTAKQPQQEMKCQAGKCAAGKCNQGK